jgi:transposase-like protein
LKWETRDQFFGRVASIVRVHSQKLSDDRYRQAWDLHRTGMTVKDVAARFSVSRQTLYANWKRLGLRRNQG